MNGLHARLGAVLALLAVPALAFDTPDTSARFSAFAPCETAVLDLGTPATDWHLEAGFAGRGATKGGRTFARADAEWTVRWLLTDKSKRTLRMRARSKGPVVLVPRWNGSELAEGEVRRRWAVTTWDVPAEAIRIGLNRFDVRARTAAGIEPAPSTLRLDRIALRPAAECASEPSPARAVARLPLELPLGSIFVTHLPDAERVTLALAGDDSAAADAYVSSAGAEPQPLGRAAAPALAVELAERSADTVTLISTGTSALEIRDAGIESRPDFLRKACGLWQWEAVAAVALLALLLAILLPGRLPLEARAVWTDPLALFVLALGLRWIYVASYPLGVWFQDSWEYAYRARELAEGALPFWSDVSWHRWQNWIRPPGYFALVAATIRFGDWSSLFQIQAVLASLGAAASYHVAFPLFGRRAALVAGLLLAVHAHSITSSTWLLSEPLFVPLAAGGLAALAWLSTRPSRGLAVLAGVLLGLAALVRSAPLTFVWAVALCLVVARGRRYLAPAAILVASMLAVTVPWSVRNGLAAGAGPVLDNTPVANVLLRYPNDAVVPRGELDLSERDDFDVYWEGIRSLNTNPASGPGALSVYGSALRDMLGEPAATVRGFRASLVAYFAGFPRSYPPEVLKEQDACAAAAWSDALDWTWWLVFWPALAGIALALRDRRTWPILLWVVFLTVLTNLLFFAGTDPGRFRFPLLPALVAFAGLALLRLADLLRSLTSRPPVRP